MSVSRKHPHVRGEDKPPMPANSSSTEASPRAWGGHARYEDPDPHAGSIPTCVGRTIIYALPSAHVPKHPHVRGEDVPNDANGHDRVRSIPTCVGRTLCDLRVYPPWERFCVGWVVVSYGCGCMLMPLRAETHGGGWMGVDQDGADVGIWGRSNRLLRPYPVLWHLIDLSRRPATGRTRRRLGARRPLSLCGRHA